MIEKILKSGLFSTLVVLIVLFAVSYGSFYLGYQKGVKNPQTVIIKGVSNLEEGNKEAIDFSLFWETWGLIKDKYVGAEKLNNQDLVYGAISGLLSSLKDPNSVFFPPSDAKKFEEDISGEFSGIGAEIGIRNEQLVIIAPLKGTPAEKAGIKAGDKILKINDKITTKIGVDEAVKIIRGEKGTKVVLTIIRNGWEKPKEIPIIRDTIQIPTIDLKMIDNNIAHLQLYNFYEKAPYLFYSTVVEIVFKNPDGIILDLRNNPGGYLNGAVNIAGWFIKNGDVIVSEEFGPEKKEIFKSYGTGLLGKIPVVVLMNEGSASASEILAGALRDNNGSKIVGKKSFGKGSVQEVQGLKNDSLVKITVAHWLTPNGVLIDGNGLEPDYYVDLTEKDTEEGKDPQLEKAIEILKSQI